MLKNNKVVLRPLTVSDAQAFYDLYHTAGRSAGESFETPIGFTERIIALCTCIWTIRPLDHPEQIIGDCALHHLNDVSGDIQIGGSLLPNWQRRGYMTSAFQLAMQYAATHLEITTISGHTTPDNIQAINLVIKLGFEIDQHTDRIVILKKKIISGGSHE